MKKVRKATRRADGEGSVFQRKSDGRWVASTARDPRTGKRALFTAATQAEALKKRAEGKKRIDDAGGEIVKDPTVESYLRRWLDLVAKQRVLPNTLKDYRSKIETCIIPTIGKLKLSKVLPHDVRQMLLDVVAGKGRSRGKRSPRTANYCRSILAKALDDARRDRIITGDNAATLADVLPHKKPPTAWFEAHEVLKFNASLDVHPDRVLLIVAASLGLRQGEVLGMQWSLLTLDGPAPMLRVRLQLQTVNKVRQLVDLKTEKSRRDLQLSPNMAALLRAHRAAQARRALELGELWRNTLGLVFTSDVGDPVGKGRIRRAFLAAAEDAGLKRIRFHDLRHSAASLMLERNGGDLKSVSEALGHSTITITADTYAHVSKAVLARTAGALDDLVPATKARDPG